MKSDTTDPVIGDGAMPPAPVVSATATVDELRDIVREFTGIISAPLRVIPGAVKSLDARTAILRRLFMTVIAVLILDIAFTAVGGYFVVDLKNTDGRLDRSVHSQCYLDTLLLHTYRPGDAPQRLNYPKGPVGYDLDYAGLQQAADDNQCRIKHVVPGT